MGGSGYLVDCWVWELMVLGLVVGGVSVGRSVGSSCVWWGGGYEFGVVRDRNRWKVYVYNRRLGQGAAAPRAHWLSGSVTVIPLGLGLGDRIRW